MQRLTEACKAEFQKVEGEVDRIQEVVTNFQASTMGVLQTELQDITRRLMSLESGYGSGGAGGRFGGFSLNCSAYFLHSQPGEHVCNSSA